MGKGGRPKSTSKDLTVSITTRLAADEAAALDRKSGGRARSAAVRLAVLAWLGMAGCCGGAIDEIPSIPACSWTITSPISSRGTVAARSTTSTWDGTPSCFAWLIDGRLSADIRSGDFRIAFASNNAVLEIGGVQTTALRMTWTVDGNLWSARLAGDIDAKLEGVVLY